VLSTARIEHCPALAGCLETSGRRSDKRSGRRRAAIAGRRATRPAAIGWSPDVLRCSAWGNHDMLSLTRALELCLLVTGEVCQAGVSVS
jgi:hypothetical protein